MDTCTIFRKQKTSLVKPAFSANINIIPWHRKERNRSREESTVILIRQTRSGARISLVMKEKGKQWAGRKETTTFQFWWVTQRIRTDTGSQCTGRAPALVSFLPLSDTPWPQVPRGGKSSSSYTVQSVMGCVCVWGQRPSRNSRRMATPNQDPSREHGRTVYTGLLSTMVCSSCFSTQPRTTCPGGALSSAAGPLHQSLILNINININVYRRTDWQRCYRKKKTIFLCKSKGRKDKANAAN